MAAQKKAKKKPQKKTQTKKAQPRSKAPKKPAKKPIRKAPQKKAAKTVQKKIAPKKGAPKKVGKTQGSAPKKPGASAQGSAEQRVYGSVYKESSRARTLPADNEDLEGVSATESADSESVEELLDEGNAFEAGAVEGVERADDEDEREVRTREVPEDDVPEEYLDED